MMLYARSCERPSNSSARVFLPSSVSNSYSFSTGTQGSSRRLRLTSSPRCACSASSFASSSRAACHSSRVPILCSGISSSFRLGPSRSKSIVRKLPGPRAMRPPPAPKLIAARGDPIDPIAVAVRGRRLRPLSADAETRFPGESSEYRRERNRLLEAELELRRAVERVAAQRRALPPGGAVPDDYPLEEAAEGGGEARLSELFAPGKDTLVIYS